LVIAASFRRCKRLIAELCGDGRGNVFMIVGLGAPLLLGTAGFSVDYAYASYLKQSLDKALDISVLAATSQTAATSGGGYSNTAWMRQYGLNIWGGNTANLGVSVTPTLTVASNGTGGVIANGSYTYAMPTTFSNIIGIPTITLNGTAQATANPLTYLNYYIVLDISQSMGIAATQADMTSLFSRTTAYGNGGCVFGCHVKTSGQPYTNEYLAHNVSPRINLRIDAAISAIQTIIADAQAAAGTSQNIKIGLYTMSADPISGTKLNTLSAPSTNYTNLTTLAAGITLGNNNSGGTGDTDFTTQLAQFALAIPTDGSGSNAASPKNYVFIVTDGVKDTPGVCTSGHCTAAFDPALCTPLKAKAVVGTIYTTYLPIYNNNNPGAGFDINYTQLVAPFVSQIAPNLKSCATNPGYYYEATDGPALNEAMKALFASTLKTARITQ
jgi:Flp pilus assembly protein TadG